MDKATKLITTGYKLLVIGFSELILCIIFYIMGSRLSAIIATIGAYGLIMAGIIMLTGLIFVIIGILPHKKKQ